MNRRSNKMTLTKVRLEVKSEDHSQVTGMNRLRPCIKLGSTMKTILNDNTVIESSNNVDILNFNIYMLKVSIHEVNHIFHLLFLQ